jgi:hypothetical protein
LRRAGRRETDVHAGEFDYDETVDLLLNMEGAEAPVAMERLSLAKAIQVVIDQWPPLSKGSVLITRDGPDLTSYDEVLAIYNRDDFPRPPVGHADTGATAQTAGRGSKLLD